ncbi:hypothetical protein Hanom_Chr13g01197371 [Helianthus anomalus]
MTRFLTALVPRVYRVPNPCNAGDFLPELAGKAWRFCDRKRRVKTMRVTKIKRAQTEMVD